MEKIFESLRALDKRAEESFNLKNGLLMEHAAAGMAEYIKTNLLPQYSSPENVIVQIVCGSGDNGGDGLALARLLYGLCTIRTVIIKEPHSPLAQLQKDRLQRLSIPLYTEINDSCTILVDSFLGTGLTGILHESAQVVISRMNAIKAYKIACDIPSGLNMRGMPSPVAFHANETHSMGALKTAFYADAAKDYTGTIKVMPLGLPRQCYETATDTFLLSAEDMKLPVRTIQNTHKMQYGHVVLFCGEKKGACYLAASAALHFGSGLVSIYGENVPFIVPDYMYVNTLPDNFSVTAVGSGLGRTPISFENALSFLMQPLVQQKPAVLDADIFYSNRIDTILRTLSTPILTPHPKEFHVLLKNCGLADATITEIQQNRFHYVRLFCEKYPHAVLLLKGAYSLIGQDSRIFVNPLGSAALAKAGSGDVLTGMIAALAAQGYNPLDAAITASLAHAQAATLCTTNYGLTPSTLAETISKL